MLGKQELREVKGIAQGHKSGERPCHTSQPLLSSAGFPTISQNTAYYLSGVSGYLRDASLTYPFPLFGFTVEITPTYLARTIFK